MATASSGTAVVTLPTDTQILITRDFAAPKHLIYKAWTTPELIKRWWSANRGEVILAEVDLRVGGKWRYVMLADARCFPQASPGAGGVEVGFHGEYREIVPNERIVSTEVFEGAPEAEAVDTLTLTESGGCTTLTILVQHQTTEHRDMHIESGMEAGLQDALDLLEGVAISLDGDTKSPS
ncbi:MAG TPA: SRPBCC family protein [Gemmatimonadales bacterium]|nr:SRPBCC family protein [Gemmatimonadales bacterium]